MTRDLHKRVLLGLYLTALLPRLVLLSWMMARGDIPVFLSAGRDLAFWDVFPLVSFRILFKIVGDRLLILAFLYAIIAALIAPVVRQVAVNLSLSRTIALRSGLGVAFYPYYVSTAGYQPEFSITILLTALCVLALLRFGHDPSLRRALLAVSIGCLLLLDRPDGVFFVLFVGGIAAWPRRKLIRMGFVLATTVLVAFSVIGMVNLHYSGRFSPVPGKSAYNLLLGNNAAVNDYLRTNHATTMERYVLDTAFKDFPENVQQDKQNPVYSNLYRQRALEFIRAHPGLTLENTGYKFLRYWDWRLEDAAREPPIKNAIYSCSYLFVLLAGVWGSLLLVRRGQRYPVVFAWGSILAFCLPGLVTIPLIRVRMFSEFFLIILAAVAIDTAATRSLSRRRT